jgi:hypothetical protein
VRSKLGKTIEQDSDREGAVAAYGQFSRGYVFRV